MDGHARIPVTTSSTAPAFVALIDSLRSGLDVRQSFSSADNYQERTNFGFTGRVEYDAENFGIVSLTSYRDNDYSWRDNLGGLPFPAFPLEVDDRASEKASQFSQEFRLVSKPEQPISWVAGVYYFNENIGSSSVPDCRSHRRVSAVTPPSCKPRPTPAMRRSARRPCPLPTSGS